MGDNIKVAIKFRPLIQREVDSGMKKEWTVRQNQIVEANGNPCDVEFDHIFDENSSTEFVFNDAVKPIVADCLRGFNGSIMAYGQTSSGKTHIMMGTDNVPGIIQMAINEIFEEIDQQQENREFLIRVSYLEIYNEKVNDLLNPEQQDIKILEQANGDIYIQCLECITSNPSMVMEQLTRGNKNRCVGETNMNEKSSRSHTIFRVIIESRIVGETDNDAAVQIGTLNLVDLAGSEKAEQSGASGSRFKEGTFINKSLLSLSKVINQLIEQPDDQKPKHVNYRDSKLTRLLQHSLGGNAKSVIICAVTPAAAEETRSTLGFAARAKTIKNKPRINEVLTDQAMIKRLQKQIVSLEKELDNVKANNSKKDILREISECQEYFIRSDRRMLNTKKSTRRRTWAATEVASVKDTQTDLGIGTSSYPNASTLMPPPTFFNSKPIQNYVSTEQNFDMANEIFLPGETVNLDKSPSPTKFPFVHTPHCMKRRLSLIRESDDSPRTSEALYKERINALQRELDELQEFTKLEKFIHDHEDNRHTCEKEIKRLTDELHNLNEDLIISKESSNRLSEELQEMKRMQNQHEEEIHSVKNDIDTALKAQSNAQKKQKEAEDILNSKIFEFEAWQKKAKNREQELLERLNDAQKGDEQVIENSQSLVNDIRVKETEIFNLQKTLEDERSKYEKILQQNDIKMQSFVSDNEELLQVKNNSFEELHAKMQMIEKELRKAVTEPRNGQICIQNIFSLFDVKNSDYSLGPDDLMCDFSLKSLNDTQGVTNTNCSEKDALNDVTLKNNLECNEIKQFQILLKNAIDINHNRMKTFELDLEKKFEHMFSNIEKMKVLKSVLAEQLYTKTKAERTYDKEEVNQLRIKIMQMTDEMNAFEATISNLQKINMQIENELKFFKSSTENKAHLQEIDELKQKLDILTNEKLLLEKEYDEISNQVMEAIEESDDLKVKLEEANSKITETKFCLQQLTDQKLNLENENKLCKERVLSLEALITEYDQCCTKLKDAELVEKNTSHVPILEESSKTTETCTDKENSIYEDAMNDKDIIDAQLQTYQNKIDLLTQENSELQSGLLSLPELQEEIQELRSQLSELMQLVDSEQEIKIELSSKLEILQNEIKVKTSELEKALSKDVNNLTTGGIKEIELQLKNEKLHNIELQKQIKYLLETLEDRTFLIKKEIETTIEKLQLEIEKRLEKISMLSTSLTSQRQKLITMRAQKRRLENESNLQISAISKELEDMRNEKSVVQNQLDETLSKLLFQEEHTLPTLKLQLSDLTNECNKLKASLSVSEEKVSIAEAQLKSVQAELDSRMNTFIQTDTKLVELEKLFEDTNQKCDDAQKLLSQNVALLEEKEMLHVKLKEELHFSQLQMEQEKQAHNKIQMAVAALEDENQRILSEFSQATQEIENLKIELSSQAFTLSTKDASISDLKMKLEQLTKERNNSQAEHKQVQSRNEVLRLEIDEMKRVKSDDRRRSHRSTLHDSTRFLDKTQSVQVQTMPTDTNCQCSDLNQKIQALKKDNFILKLKLDNHDLESNYLIDKEKVKAEEWEKQTGSLKADLIRAQQKIREVENSIRTCVVCESKNPSKSCFVQTEDETGVISMNSNSVSLAVQSKVDYLNDELTVLKRKYEDTKKLCRIRNEKIRDLENSAGKENETQNCQLSSVLAENSTLKKNIIELEDKYSELKRGFYVKQQQPDARKIGSTQTTAELINIEQYQALEEILLLKGSEFEVLDTKYQRCKKLCIARKESHLKMEAKFAEIQEENKRLVKILEDLEKSYSCKT